MINKEEILRDLNKDPKAFLVDGIWYYGGLLNKRNPNKLISNAYRIWCDQGDRCNNRNSKAFKDYGAKNIQRIWTSREFVDWYVNELLKKDYWDFPHVSRIRDEGNYSLDNCFIQERLDNIKEMHINKYVKRDKNLINKVINILEKYKIDIKIIDEIRVLEG